MTAVSDPPIKTGRPASAMKWSTLNVFSSKLASLVIGIALARMLGPAEFGLFAVAMVALLAVLAVNDIGVSMALVRWQDDPAEIAPTVTTIAIGFSVVVTIVVLALAGPFVDVMGAPEAKLSVQLLSLCVLANGVLATPAMLLQRHFRQDHRMLVDQVNIWLGAIASLVLVLLGMGVLALVLGRLLGTLASGMLLLKFSPLPFRLGFDPAIARRLVVFGAPLAGASLIVFALASADQLVVGHQLSHVALGAFVLAVNLASWPIQLLSQPLRGVAPAVFARLQDRPGEMRDGLVRISRPLLALALPSCVALSLGADQVVHVLYGEEWAATAGPLRWLALLAALRIFAELTYDYLLIAGPTWWLMVLQAGWLAVMLPALVIGAQVGGLAGAAVAQLLVALLGAVPAYLWLLRRVGVAPWRLLAGLGAPSAGCGLLVGIAQLLQRAGLSGPPLLYLAVIALASLGIGGILLYRLRSDLSLLRRGEV